MKYLHKNKLYKSFIPDIVIFTIFWLYLSFFIDIKLIYHGAGRILDFPVFFKTTRFLLPHLSYPAGLLEYVNAFISQLFYYSPLGSAVIVIITFFAAVFIRNIFKKSNLPALSFLGFLPALIMIVTFSQYSYRLPCLIAITIVFAFVSLYCSSRPRNHVLDLLFLLLLSVVVYSITAAAFFVFVAMVILYRLLNSYNKLVTTVFILAAVVLPYIIGVMCFRDSLNNAYSRMMPFAWDVIIVEQRKITLVWLYVLYFTLPAVLAFCYLYRLMFKCNSKTDSPEKNGFFAALRNKIAGISKKPPVKIALVLILFAVIHVFILDAPRRIIFQVDYHLAERNWEKVISCAKKFPKRNYYIVNLLDQALYHQGKLGEQMFEFPQHPFGLFLSEKSHVSIHWPKISLLMDLGFVNYAEHETVESLEKFGPQPYLLKNMAISFLAKRNYKTAKVYLNKLSNMIFENKWADNYLQKLKTDPDLQKDTHIQYLRKNMITDNYSYLSLPIDRILNSLLQRNPKNKMAFEYLMTWYLLTGKIDQVVRHFEVMAKCGYKKLPKYYQQAYLIHTLAMQKQASLFGYKIDPEVERTSRQAIGYFNMLRMGDSKGLEMLEEKYSDTYIFYFVSLPSMMQKSYK